MAPMGFWLSGNSVPLVWQLGISWDRFGDQEQQNPPALLASKRKEHLIKQAVVNENKAQLGCFPHLILKYFIFGPSLQF
jgi:hypothetical protein